MAEKIFFKDDLDLFARNYCPMSLIVLFGFLGPFNMSANANAIDSLVLSLTLRSHKTWKAHPPQLRYIYYSRYT